MAALIGGRLEIIHRRSTRRLTGALLALAAMLSTAPAVAQGFSERAFRSFTCKFESGTTARFDTEWDVKAAGDKIDFRLEGIDTAQAKAKVVGPFGMTNALLFRGNSSLNFLEIASDGNQTFTTIFFSYQREGKQQGTAVWYPAVHSRHMMIGRNPVVSHYRGYCQPN